MAVGSTAIGRRASRVGAWMTAHEVQRTGRTSPRASAVTALLIYAVGFGMAIYAAIHYLASPALQHRARTEAGGWSFLGILELSLIALATIVAAILLTREAPTWAKPVTSGSRWVAELKSFGLGWTATFAGSITATLIGPASYPESHHSSEALPSMVNSLLAGPGEEIVVLVTPLVLLRAAKWPWWAVVPAMLALRLAYHVYYGFPAAGLLVWALAVIFVYLRSHAVVGLIVAHSYWDMTQMIGHYWSEPIGVAMFLVPFLCIPLWGLVSLILWIVRKVERKAQAKRAATGIGWHQGQDGHWWWWDGQNWFAHVPPGTGAQS